MKKQLHNPIFRAVLLLLFLCSVTAWAASGIVATDADDFQFSLSFDSTAVEKCQIVVTNPSGQSKNYEWKASGTLDGEDKVPRGSKIEVTIVLKPGKIADHLDGNPQPIQNNKITWNGLYEDVDARIVCINRTYPVTLLGPNGSGDISYVSNTDPDLLTKFLSGNVKYQAGSGVRVELPEVSLHGYHFKGWYLVTGSGNDAKEAITPDQDGKYYIPDDRSNVYFDTQNAIFVYPEMEPEQYLIWRQDCIWDEVNGMASTLLAPNYSQYAKFDSNYSALYAIYDSVIYDSVMWNDDIGGTFKQYPGFLLKDDAVSTDYGFKKVVMPDADAKTNQVIRYYLPISYTLTYWDDNGGRLPENGGFRENGVYKYGNTTDIARPTRTGYDFLGWTVEIYRGGAWVSVVHTEDQNATHAGITKADFSFGRFSLATLASGGNDENAIYASEKNEADGAIEYEIRLTANWQATRYSVVYDWGLSADALQDLINWMNTNNASVLACNSFVYDTASFVPSPIRPGYSFKGWKVYCAEKGTENWILQEGVFLTPGEDGTVEIPNYANDLKLEADWTAENYQIILDPNGGVSGEKTQLSVTYDQLLSIPDTDQALILPKRAGYSFAGFFSAAEGGIQYINADGSAVAGQLWKEDGGENGSTVTLYARWIPKPYDVEIDFGTVEGVTVTVTPEGGESFVYDGKFRLPYGAKFTVSVTAPDGYKVTWFDGDIDDAVTYTAELTVGAWEDGKVLAVKVLPVRAFNPTLNIDYREEQLIGLAPGTYLIRPEGSQKDITIHIASVGGACLIEDAWFGKTIFIIYCGDEEGFADSEPQAVTLVARPDTPNQYDPDNTNPPEIDRIGFKGDRVEITFTPGNEGLYEFAIRESGDKSQLVWGSDLTGLKPGTRYDLYIRKKATDSAPHGMVAGFSGQTDPLGYKESVLDQLEQIRKDNPGEVTDALIDEAIKRIEELAENSDNFYDEAEKLIAEIRDQRLQVAISKDKAITELKQFRDDCLKTGFFNAQKRDELNDICNTAIDQIKALPDDCELTAIDAIYHPAMNAMKRVDIHHLSDTDGNASVTLESEKGLYQDSRLNIVEQIDFETLMKAVDKAIRTPGKIAVNGFMSTEKAEEILRGLNVFAAYRFELSHDDKVKDGDVFTVRLLLSDALKNKTGLQVAYYNATTGTVELLETRVEGDYLVFTASRIADFVVLGDPTLELGGVIIALGAVLFCQIIAIALILLSRNGFKNKMTHAAIMLPVVSLTVHFSPVNGEWIALIMAIAVVLLQIVLMVLLFSSNMVFQPPKKRRDSGEPSIDVFAQPAQNDAYASPADGRPENEKAETPVDGADDAEAYVNFHFDQDGETDPFAMYGDGEDVSTEDGYAGDFIEPAAPTRYSLPDEEEGFSFDDGDAGDEAEISNALEDAEDPFTSFLYDDGEEAYEEDDAEEIADAEPAYAAYDDETAYAEEYAEEYEEEEYVDEERYEEGAYEDETFDETYLPADEDSDDGEEDSYEEDPYRYDE